MGVANHRMALAAGLAVLAVAIAGVGIGGARGGAAASHAGLGEARPGGLTVPLAPALAGVTVTKARTAGRPIVVIDPGHGGSDPGAPGVSGTAVEKDLALVLARELRDHLAQRGRVRVALTRDEDRYLSLDQRAAIARQLSASLYISLHMDSAQNPEARGASVYSLSDVASDAAAARLASIENRDTGGSDARGPVDDMLSDLALRDTMVASAQLAERLVAKAGNSIPLRPEPHRFAHFHVLRRAQMPAVLFEAGYISNPDDEILLRDPAHRRKIVAILARAIEADIAARRSG